MAITKDDILNAVKEMKVIELHELVEALKEEFGVTAAAPVAVAGGAAGGEAATEEKSSFDVILVSSGGSKIPVIKEVRAITGLGLKEAKELVDAGGKPVKQGVSKEEADEIKGKLEAAGASVEIK